MADDSGIRNMVDRLNDRLHELEKEHIELKSDVRNRVERMEQRLEQFADTHEAQSEKLDTLIDMGRKRDGQVDEINKTVKGMAPQVNVIKEAMVLWRFLRWPTVTIAGGLISAAIAYFSPPTWLKGMFK